MRARVEAQKVTLRIGIAWVQAAKVALRIGFLPKCGEQHTPYSVIWHGRWADVTGKNGAINRAFTKFWGVCGWNF